MLSSKIESTFPTAYPPTQLNMLLTLLASALLVTVARAHVVLSYPAWRGNTLITNATYPYGMQWTFPCGCSFYPDNVRLVHSNSWQAAAST